MPGRANIPEVPMGVRDQATRRWMQEVRNSVISLLNARIPPKIVTNFTVTPQALSNLISFTKSAADFYILYISDSPSFSEAAALPLGSNSRHSDFVGKSSFTRHYWVESWKLGGIKGSLSEAVSGTTLVSTAEVTPPTPPPPSEFPSIDEERDELELFDTL